MRVGAEALASLTPTTAPLHVGCMPAPAAGTQQNFVGEIDESLTAFEATL